MSPEDQAYADRLLRARNTWWKRYIDVQRPFTWNLAQLNPGETLDIGCGIGRSLSMLPKGSIGVDFNIACVQACRNAGLEAYTPDHLPNKTFDTLLFSHVLEHTEDPETVIRLYLPHLRKTGQVVALTPQERGYSADPTHVRFLDASALAEIFERVGLEVERSYSFPLPRWAGTWLRYNEFVVTGRRNHVS